MNDIQEQSIRHERGGVFADPGRMAPSIEKAWRDAFIVELRLLGVPGDRIGDALLTTQSHVHESGESAQEAFGDPTAYAREIAESGGSVGSGWQVSSMTVVSMVLGLAGMLASVRALSARLDHEVIEITAGDLVGWGVLGLLVGALLARFDTVLRFAVRHIWLAMAAPLVLVATIAATLALLTQPVLDVEWPPVAVLAVVALTVSTVAGWLDASPEQDEIVAPGQSSPPSVVGRAATVMVLPFLTGLLLLLTWALSRAA